MTDTALREEMVKACKVRYAAKDVGDGLGGHLSARLDEQRILIKPRPAGWRTLEPQDLMVIGANCVRVDGVQEWPIHARIYTARPDVQCILHAHPAASTLLAALGIQVEPLDQDCTAFTDRLPVLDSGAVTVSRYRPWVTA